MTSRNQLFALLLLGACSTTLAQSPGEVPEVHPPLPSWKCTTSKGCIQQNTSVVLDWEFRDIHVRGSTTSCKGGNDKSYTLAGNGVNPAVCPDATTCAKNCVVEGANYASFGVSTSGNALTLKHYVRENGRLNYISPRVYLLGADGNYAMMNLLNQELSVTVDYSDVPCGQNGALYLSEMDPSGGRGAFNPGGANYGSGYCDAQCPTMVWKNGTLDTSRRGYCCNEMDVLEANSAANAFTPHPCRNGACDKNGCGYNPYASGQRNFWGPGKQIDTNKPFTVITQFVASGTTLTRVDRKYIQNGRTINSPGSITNCGSGGLQAMGDGLRRGMVLAMSMWNDATQAMAWLDSGNNGPCPQGQGTPANIERTNPDTNVIFSNIRWGDIGSTTK